MDCDKIGKLLAELRKSKGLTQNALAEFLCVSDKAVSKWESGNGLPDIQYLPELAKIFEISIDELLAGERTAVSDFNNAFENIICGKVSIESELKKGLNINTVNEYGMSLCDYMIKHNKIDFFDILKDLGIIKIYDFEIIDTSKKEKSNSSELRAFLVKNSRLNILKQLNYFERGSQKQLKSNRNTSGMDNAAIARMYNEKDYFVQLEQNEFDSIVENFAAFEKEIIKDKDMPYIFKDVLKAAITLKNLKVINKLVDKVEQQDDFIKQQDDANKNRYNNIREFESDLGDCYITENLPSFGQQNSIYKLGRHIKFTNEMMEGLIFVDNSFFFRLAKKYGFGLTQKFAQLLIENKMMHELEIIFDMISENNLHSEELLVYFFGMEKCKIQQYYFDKNKRISVDLALKFNSAELAKKIIIRDGNMPALQNLNIDHLFATKDLELIKMCIHFLSQEKKDDALNRICIKGDYELQLALIESGAKIKTANYEGYMQVDERRTNETLDIIKMILNKK